MYFATKFKILKVFPFWRFFAPTKFFNFLSKPPSGSIWGVVCDRVSAQAPPSQWPPLHRLLAHCRQRNPKRHCVFILFHYLGNRRIKSKPWAGFGPFVFLAASLLRVGRPSHLAWNPQSTFCNCILFTSVEIPNFLVIKSMYTVKQSSAPLNRQLLGGIVLNHLHPSVQVVFCVYISRFIFTVSLFILTNEHTADTPDRGKSNWSFPFSFLFYFWAGLAFLKSFISGSFVHLFIWEFSKVIGRP